MSKILLPALMSSYRQLKDYSWSITFNTGELTDEQLLIIRSIYQQQCFVLVKSEKIDSQEESLIGSLQPSEKPKSPSQRLRNVLFRLYEQKGSPGKSFNEFYESTMEKIINEYKSELK